METRLFQVLVSTSDIEKILEIFEQCDALAVWQVQDGVNGEERVVVNALVSADSADNAMDELQQLEESGMSLRVVLLTAQATLPRPPEPEERPDDDNTEKPRWSLGSLSVTTEELVTEVNQFSRVRPIYLVTVAISSVVAGVGLLQNNIAAIIGAMVIAPLLGPNVALSLATTLGDLRMAARAAVAAFTGVALGITIAAVAGLLVDVDTELSEISLRTEVTLADVLVALGSGGAAALAFTTGISTTLIGVMVAVALLPPAITLGLLIGSGKWELATGTALLLLVNVASVNLAAVLVFLVQGVRPANYWEAERAQVASKVAVVLWVTLIVLLSIGIWFSQNR